MARKQRILIIDDDPNLTQLIVRVMQRANYEVHTAENGIDGLNKVQELRPDLAIIDVMMPLVDGLEVCRRLRANPATRQLPVIMLSAMDMVDDKINGFQAGADDYVAKPVELKELLARTKALLQRSKMSQPTVARIISLVGAKGGVGTTTVALNVAVALARQGKAVVLAELRRYGGSIRYHLKYDAGHDLGALLEMDPAHIKRPEVERRILRHSTGLQLMLAPDKIVDQVMTGEHVERILDVLTERADYVFLDLPDLAGPGARRALELSDQVLLVTEPESLSVSCGRVQLERMKEWGVFDRVDLVVVARTPSATLFNRVEVENRLGMGGHEAQAASRWEPRALEVDIRMRQGAASVVPAAPELFHESVREGVPLILIEPSAQAARALLDLAEWLVDRDTESPQPSDNASKVAYVT